MEEYKNIDQVAFKKLKAKGLVIDGEQNVDFYFYSPMNFKRIKQVWCYRIYSSRHKFTIVNMGITGFVWRQKI